MSTTINMQEADFETKDRSAMVLKITISLQKPCLGKKQGQARAKSNQRKRNVILKITNSEYTYCKYSHAYRNQ